MTIRMIVSSGVKIGMVIMGIRRKLTRFVERSKLSRGKVDHLSFVFKVTRSYKS